MEIVAPIFWVLSLCTLWVTYSRKPAALRMVLGGLALMVVGAILGGIAIGSV